LSATKLLRHLRLFPAVIIVGGGLLAIKSVGLVHDAYAQTAMTGQVAAPPPQDTTQVAVADPSVDDADSSSAAEIAVLTSLSKRRSELDAREQDLDMQANLIAAAEQRVDGKIASLKDLQSQMQTLLGQRDAADQAQINALVKTYSSMKPADAARIFNSLDETVELNVAALMKSDVLGAILAKMQPDIAEKLTVRLANRLKLPDPAAATAASISQTCPVTPAAPTQTAALDPAATPTPVTPSPTPPAAQADAGSTAKAPAPNTTPTPPATPPAAKQQAATAPAKTQAASTSPPAPAKTAAATPKASATSASATPAPAMKKGS
jgi:flagellar motility protein MotE (MotC chaperone)